MNIYVNDQVHPLVKPIRVDELLRTMQMDARRVAVEVNLRLIPRTQHASTLLSEGDRVEIVTLVGGGAPDEMTDDPLTVGKYVLASRLIVGTGKYKNLEETAAALEASGTSCVTVAVRRVWEGRKPDAVSKEPTLLDIIDPQKYLVLPNTAGCYNADDALRTARLAREIVGTELVKLEVLGDDRTLLPDPVATLEAARVLVREGFTVMAYTSDDPIMARRLEEVGVACVMPAGAPIGSGQGILNPNNIRIILEQAKKPVIVDAGVGTASDVSMAMELGCDGVLLNTGIAGAKDPIRMAHAMRHAVRAGRLAFLAGRIPKRLYAKASSPTEGLIESVRK